MWREVGLLYCSFVIWCAFVCSIFHAHLQAKLLCFLYAALKFDKKPFVQVFSTKAVKVRCREVEGLLCTLNLSQKRKTINGFKSKSPVYNAIPPTIYLAKQARPHLRQKSALLCETHLLLRFADGDTFFRLWVLCKTGTIESAFKLACTCNKAFHVSIYQSAWKWDLSEVIQTEQNFSHI